MVKVEQNRIRLLSKIKLIQQDSFYNDRELPKLIAVSKKQPNQKIIEALDCGQKTFGENRVQEAENRWIPLIQKYKKVELHLIGQLQTNKVKRALKLFDVIHSLDRESLAIEISKNLNDNIKTKSFFIQVNTGKEKQKSGILPEHLEDFYNLCSKKLYIPVEGLMCIPPINETPSIHFCFIKKMCDELKLQSLSIGMSSDFDEAIKFGATHIRIGTDFFGERIN